MSIQYTPTAQAQLKHFEDTAEDDLWEGIVDAIELIVNHTGMARRHSEAINGREGIVYFLPVNGHESYKVFWTSEIPRIEAVFPHP